MEVVIYDTVNKKKKKYNILKIFLIFIFLFLSLVLYKLFLNNYLDKIVSFQIEIEK